jgi:Zinc carboxypeptidase
MRIAAPLLLSAILAAQDADAPKTVPEATDYQRTSTVAEVQAFLAQLPGLPHGDRLRITVAGKSHDGRDLQLVRVALPATDEAAALRALVIANIHAGEVEGKEAVQQILRELALGEHEDLLRAAALYFVPIYNPDGNEQFDVHNRPAQNGPDSVGKRPNGMGLDLNRDFVKAEAPETRALLQLFAQLDPHVFMDLHTTDGSWHGYHLTYAPSLSTNMDPALAKLSRSLLDQTTAALQQQTPSLQTFDYGNFETRDWDGGGAPESQQGVRGWWSYDHRPRYGTNYFGLRNRIAVLSEAYSNCDFKTRIAATRAFVLAVLTAAVQRQDEVRTACAAADHRLEHPDAPQYFGFDTVFAAPEQLPVLVGDCDKIALPGDLGTRFARKDTATPETMPVFRRFSSRQHLALPRAWALPQPPAAVTELLALHGIRSESLAAERPVRAETFAIAKKRKPKRPFQGHQELVLDGAWQPAADVALPIGTLWIPADQPLGRLAAQLLEPQSEDSLSNWNFLEQETGDVFPVVRVVAADK